MMALPFGVEKALTSTHSVMAHTQGLQTLHGYVGHEEDGEPVVVIVADIPTQVRLPLDKAETELLDVRRFLIDLGHGEAPLVPGGQPNSPPDTIATIRGEQVRIEAAQLHLPQQSGRKNNTHASRYFAFDHLRKTLITQSTRLSGALRQHRGYVVYVWFGDPLAVAGARFPTRTPEALIDLLCRAQPPPPPPRGPLPQQASDGTVALNEDKTIGISWGNLPPEYNSGFATALGFELGLSYNVTIRSREVAAEVRRIVTDHDASTVDVLVISTNAAMANGLHFPSAHFVADLAFNHPNPLDQCNPKHLKGVALHDPAAPGRVRWLFGDGLP
jgi:hypothetical protein